jgi:DNA-binding NarL/FixJ family response regulator
LNPGTQVLKRGFHSERSPHFSKDRYEERMHDTSFQILYLGEDLAWSKISTALSDAADSPLKIHRAQSLNELFLVLAGGNWHAVAVDIRAWKYQGLHYVDKVRSEYPALPILALYSLSENELALKAKAIGASRCLLLEQLTPASVHSAVASCLSEKKSPFHSRKAPSMPANVDSGDSAAIVSSKNESISHALSNLLCVISANADVLADHVALSGPGGRSLSEIKRAAKSAADLTRLLR